MYKNKLPANLWLLSIVFISMLFPACRLMDREKLTLSCREDNDLFVVLQENIDSHAQGMILLKKQSAMREQDRVF